MYVLDQRGVHSEIDAYMSISVVCSLEDLFPPDVDSKKPVFTGTVAVYSFTGGNVTYNGVFSGSIATYRASEGYLINGTQSVKRKCSDDYTWTPEGFPIIRNKSE